MTLEQQVTSLELSKRLKELGVKQESIFYHNILDGSPVINQYLVKNRKQFTEDGYPGNTMMYKSVESYSAFTVAELGELLPVNSTVEICRPNPFGKCAAITFENTEETHREYAGTEANARAKMVCYLLENGLINI